MRLKIILRPERPTTIPLNYSHQLSSATYNMVGDGDAEYAAFLHGTGYSSASPAISAAEDSVDRSAVIEAAVTEPHPLVDVGMPRRFKLFTFSQLRAERSRVHGANLVLLPGSVEWIVSSPVEKFVREFATGLLLRGSLRIGPHEIPISGVETLPVPKVGPEMRLKCLSPIVATVTEELNGKRWARYLRPKDPAFSERIRQNLLGKHLALYGCPPEDDRLTLQFDAAYLARNKGTKLITYKDINIVGAWCPFSLQGSTELIRLGYDCGLGEKNAAGFGLVEAIKA